MTDYEAAFWKLKNNWHESVRHYEERIEKLEAANLQQSLITVDHLSRIEKLEAALRYYADEDYNGYNGSGEHARKVLEDK